MKKFLYTSAFILGLALIPCTNAFANETVDENPVKEVNFSPVLSDEYGTMALLGQANYTLSSSSGTRSFNFITGTGQIKAEFLNVTGDGVSAALYRANGQLISMKGAGGGSNTTKVLEWTSVPRNETLYLIMYSYSARESTTLRVHN